MSDEQPPLSFINRVCQMGFPLSSVHFAQQVTNSNDPDILLEWILSHTNELELSSSENVDEKHLAKQAIDKVIECGFPKRSAELAQKKTKSNDVQLLIDWILTHDTEVERPSPATSNTNLRQSKPNNSDTFINDLSKLGFDTNNIRSCLIDLNIDTRKISDSNKKQTQCINWLIDHSRKQAQVQANQIDRSRKQLRMPIPIDMNQYSTKNSQPISNNFLKQIHLSNRQQTTRMNQKTSELTPEEARMFDIDEHLRKQDWTIHNLDQLGLIQRYLQIVSKIIYEDHHNIQRYNDDNDDLFEPIQKIPSIEPKNERSKRGIFTLADLVKQDQKDERSFKNKQLDVPPAPMSIPGAMDEANWNTSLLTTLDPIAVQFEYRPGENYRQFLDRLIDKCQIRYSNQLSKIRAIFVWITSHIRYDIKTSERDNSLDKTDHEMDTLCDLILQTSTCVCVGYAVMLKRMCQYFNIQVNYINGYTKLTKSCLNDTKDSNNIESLSGHAWNMVHIDRKTYFTDPTWSAAHWSSTNKLLSPFSNTYYLVLPRYSIYQFFPHNHLDQHIDSPWSIPQFLREPCFYPHFFRSKFTLEDQATEWFWYRIPIERNDETKRTKSFRITTRKRILNSSYPFMITGAMYWSQDLRQLTNENLPQLYKTDYEYKLNEVEFQQIDLNLADNHLKNKNPLFIGELHDIPIYPLKLNINQIQFGLLDISTTDQSSGYYHRIFQCIFEFQ